MFKNLNPTKIQHRIFTFVSSFTTFLVLLSFINNIFDFVKVNPIYLYILQQALLVYVGLFLMIRFNPIKKFKHENADISSFEAEVAFHASFILLLSTAVIHITEHFLKKEETKVVKDIKKKNK